MKYLLIISTTFLTFSLFAQQKGATPVQSTDGGQQSGSTYAVVVGISDYQDEEIPDLRFADKDALAFAGFLQSPAGGSLDEDHLKVLINEKATVAQFAIALDWLWEVVKENDRVIIYFSGHGDVERKSITQPGYLLCWDAPSKIYLAGGALALPMFQDVVTTLSAQNKAKVIVITDACRSGKLSGSSVGGAQITGANLAKQYANEIKILSCQPDEYSIEGEQWGGGRGAFSYHLLDGLYGMADRDNDQSINLREIDRYLEDHVTPEVAPQNQLPMVVGDSREKLTNVFPDILAQLKEAKKGEIPMFTATESRGIEDDVLAAADTSVVEMYFAFKKALEDKQFLFAEEGRAENDFADYYFEKLIAEPSLEKLHSSMRRNYAAALQDDAQQVMNTLLKSGLTKLTLKEQKGTITFSNYPAHLQRASELLGNEHYMYNTLQARKLYFKGMTQKSGKEARTWLHKALTLEPEMPHAMTGLISTFIYGEYVDSAEYYFQKAIDLIPSWVEPYIKLSLVYNANRSLDKAEEVLRMAGKIDSSSVKVWYYTANAIKDQRKYEEAIKYYKKVIEATAQDVCFPCASNNLGWTYKQLKQYEEAEKYYTKAIQLDSTFILAYGNLAFLLRLQSQNEKAKIYINKGLSIDSTISLIWNLAWVIFTTEGIAAASTFLDTGIAKRTSARGKATLLYVKGFLEYYANHPNESLTTLRQAAAINGKYQPFALAMEKLIEKDYESAALYFEEAIEKNPGADNIKYIYCQLKVEQGDFDGALELLGQTMGKGRTFDFINTDPKLDPLRQMPEFKAMMKKYYPSKYKD